MKYNNSDTLKRKGKESFKQKLLRKMYPIIKKIGRKGKNGTVFTNSKNKQPIKSLYKLTVQQNNGKSINLSDYEGRKLILVNTASNCGYTGQYEELQSLHERFGSSVGILAFPANDFAKQEQSNDTEIAQFCQINYGVRFPVAVKSVVVKAANQNAVFDWLSSENQNGWNNHAPDWNFSKYIVNEEGVLTHYFGPSISPLEDQFLDALA